MLSISTLSFSLSYFSTIDSIAFIITSDNSGELLAVSLDAIAVVAIFFKWFLLVGSIFSATCLSNSIAFSALFLYPSTITVGWTLLSINSSAFSKSEPANTTTEVVPSPTSLSTLLVTSTIIFAAGC